MGHMHTYTYTYMDSSDIYTCAYASPTLIRCSARQCLRHSYATEIHNSFNFYTRLVCCTYYGAGIVHPSTGSLEVFFDRVVGLEGKVIVLE